MLAPQATSTLSACPGERRAEYGCPLCLSFRLFRELGKLLGPAGDGDPSFRMASQTPQCRIVEELDELNPARRSSDRISVPL